MKDHILAIDLGTQSVRAVVFNTSGNIVAIERTPIRPYYSKRPGEAEQEADYFWEKLSLTCKNLFTKNEELAEKVRALSVTTQRSTVVVVDRKGKALRPAIVWPDQRREKNFNSLGFFTELGFRFVGMYGTVKYAQAEAEINWLLANEPDIIRQGYKFLYISGYIIYKLTGLYRDSYASQVGYIPFDYKKFSWSSAGNWKWKAFPVPKDMLPELVAPGQTIGTISGYASEKTGIPKGLPVIAAAADKACELLGSGCFGSEIAGLSLGTTATVGLNTKRYIEVIPFIPPYPSAIPGMYSPEVQIYRGFWLVSWFRREFGLKEEMIAENEGKAVEELFDRFLEEVPPGSHGLVLQPYWSPGVKIPGPEAKGTVIGFGEVHTRAHLYRAIIEGLFYALRDGLERIERRSRRRTVSLRVSGGGSQSNSVLQIASDIFQLPVERPSIFETASLGAAIVAAVGSGLYDNFNSAIGSMTSVGNTFLPNPNHRDMYEDIYRNIYLKLYKKLKPLYVRIRKISGYP